MKDTKVSEDQIKIGSNFMMKAGSRYADGSRVSSKVRKGIYSVLDMNESTVSFNLNGNIIDIQKEYIYLVDPKEEAKKEEEKEKIKMTSPFKVGDRVKFTRGKKYWSNGSLVPQWVLSSSLHVIRTDGLVTSVSVEKYGKKVGVANTSDLCIK